MITTKRWTKKYGAQKNTSVTDAVNPLSVHERDARPPPARRPRGGRGLVLIVLAVVVFVAAVLVLGVGGLIPFGLLLAFSAGSDEEESRRSVSLTPRNL